MNCDMKKKSVLLSLFMLAILIFNGMNVYALTDTTDSNDMLYNRITGAIITVSIVVILWIILGIKLLKHEPKVIKVNMSDRYNELSLSELKKLEINSKEFKEMIYQKFKDIHSGLTNYDYDKLKINLTDDLYKSYIEELEKLKKKKYQNIMKDFELVTLKVYNIDSSYGLLRVDVYLNVRMFDYIMDMDTDKCIKGSNTEKMDFEFELTFVKNKNNDYVMSKKTCINQMKIEKYNE